MQPRRSPVGLLALLGLLSATLSDGLVAGLGGPAPGFLFFSSPSTGSVHYSRLLTATEQSRSAKMESKKVIGIESIKEPSGLAVDSLRKILYVIDGNSGRPKLYAARIYHTKDGGCACETPMLVASGLSSQWVAVDFRGKVFVVSDNTMFSMDATSVTSKLDGTLLAGAKAKSTIPTNNKSGNKKLDNPTFDVVYDGGAVKGVSMPRGMAVDGYRMFWTNGENGKTDGTIVQGLELPSGDTKVSPLASNVPFAHGICLTASRVFYTDDESNVFTTKVNGGAVQTVTSKMQKPRGCVFDGDGTVYVADAGDDKIVSFAGAAAELGPRRLSLALSNVKEPFGLAILHGSGASRSATMLFVVVASLFGFVL